MAIKLHSRISSIVKTILIIMIIEKNPCEYVYVDSVVSSGIEVD